MRRVHLTALVALVSALAVMACSTAPKPCLAPRDCNDGYECLAQRCLVRYDEPVAAADDRVVLFPARLATANRTIDAPRIRLGGSGNERTLYLAFDAPRATARVGTVLLTLVSRAHVSGDVELTASRLLDSWGAALPPTRASVQSARGLARGDRMVVIDVTGLATDGQGRLREELGFAIEVAGDDALMLETGAGDAHGPRLEVYAGAKTVRR